MHWPYLGHRYLVCAQVESPSDTTPEVFQVKQTRRGVQTTLTALYQGATLSTLEGDITRMTVDAIVNAANDRMDHNGGLAKDVITKGRKLQCSIQLHLSYSINRVASETFFTLKR